MLIIEYFLESENIYSIKNFEEKEFWPFNHIMFRSNPGNGPSMLLFEGKSVHVRESYNDNPPKFKALVEVVT